MSRHRNIRSMNYHDEYDGYDDVYGHSVEDSDYCVSPSTAQQYMFDRTGQHPLASYVTEDDIPEEQTQEDSLNESSSSFTRPALSDVDEARLNSCLEELGNILGDSVPEHVCVDAVIRCEFNYEQALNTILSTQDTPKPQREKRERRPRAFRRSTSEDKPVSPLARDAPSTAEPAVLLTPAEPAPAVGLTPAEPEVVITDTVGRMTFAGEQCISSGFTPEKISTSDGATNKAPEPEPSSVEAVKRDLGARMGTSSASSSRNSSPNRHVSPSRHASPCREVNGVSEAATPSRRLQGTPKPKSAADVLAARKE